MKSPLFLALFSTIFATACSKGADAAPPTTPPTAANVPAAPAANAPAAAPSAAPKAPAPALKTPSVAELGTFLGSIKDGASATAAKEPLEALVKQLETAKGTAAPAGDASGALGGLTKAVSGAAAKLGISEDVVKQIGTLLEKPEVKAAIGTTLEKLMNLVK